MSSLGASGQDLLSWAFSQTATGSFYINGSFTAENNPFPDWWGTGILLRPAVDTAAVVVIEPASGRIAVNRTDAGHWMEWQYLATATPPQVYDLPLTDGFSAWGLCSYFKTQDSVVTLNVNVTNTLVTAGDEVVIGNLPEGFRPTGHVIAAAYCNHGNDLNSKPGYIFVDYLGAVRMRGDADWTYGHASVTFFAP